ncbi:MAG: response regulator [candidate division Zixibacteria bacterium]|nr:response regulator [candidate division Zixibacteria bacterium]
MNQKNLKILVVDDEEVVAEVLGKLIEIDGHNVTVTLEGKKALEIYQKDKFDIVFTDISMPGMNGVDLTRRILELDNNAKIVAVTGHIGTQEVEKILNAGAKTFLKKPFTKKEIDYKIEEVLRID